MPRSNRITAGACARPFRCRAALFAAALSLWLPLDAHAWAQNGHRVIGEIAERHLEPDVLNRIHALLEGRGLAEIGTWADDIRSFPRWDCAQPFHYVTIEPGARYPDQGVPEGDAIEAVVYYADLLADRDAPLPVRRGALKFLVHFIGDLHQPLHVGRGCDRGGNQIKVEWFGETVSFHNVWDEKLIESENLSFTELTDFIDVASDQEIAAYQDSTPLDWAREAQELLDAAYTCDVPGDRCPCFCGDCDDGLSSFGGCLERQCTLMAAGPVRMAYGYKSRNLPVLRTQLVKGGARLAGMLGWIFSDQPSPPEDYRQLRETMRNLPEWDAAAQSLAACDGSSDHPE